MNGHDALPAYVSDAQLLLGVGLFYVLVAILCVFIVLAVYVVVRAVWRMWRNR